MAESTLTVRTLALATVALVLACGRAVHAMQLQRAASERTASRSAPIRVSPAGSGHSTIATYTNSGGGRGSASGGAGRVSTFTPGGGNNGGSIVTFAGDRVSRPTPSKATPARRPQQTASRGKKPSILPDKSEQAIITVRRPGDQPAPAPVKPAAATAPEAKVQVAQKQPAIRNAFGGLSQRTATIEPSQAAVYAHATAK